MAFIVNTPSSAAKLPRAPAPYNYHRDTYQLVDRPEALAPEVAGYHYVLCMVDQEVVSLVGPRCKVYDPMQKRKPVSAALQHADRCY